VLSAIVLRLPDDTPERGAKGLIVAYPGLVGEAGQAGERRTGDLRWRDPRVSGWLAVGAVGGHGQAAALGVIGFLVIDRLQLPLSTAQQSIAIVLMVGAIASLLSQWWLIPALRLSPAELVVWGSLLSAAGLGITGVADGLYGMTIGFALASLGFGLFRPGFTSGASLAVDYSEQNQVAGMVTSVNGVAYIFAPVIGVALYGPGAAAALPDDGRVDGRALRSGSASIDAFRPAGREHARRDEADAGIAAHRVLLQILLNPLIFLFHLGRDGGAGLLQRALEMVGGDLGGAERVA
jgi:hypothetical protein